MRRTSLALLLALAATPLAAQKQPSVAGTWTIAMEYLGSPIYFPLHLNESGGVVTGDLDGDKLQGKLTGTRLSFHAVDPRGGYEDVQDAVLSGDTLTGKLKWWEVGTKEETAGTYTFAAQRHAEKAAGPPQRHEFVPTEFHRQFSAATPPVLHMWPGDTLHTTTVDAGGFDEHGVHRSQGGNPQTGPFFIETAMPGDTLVIHLVRLKLNRGSAISDDGLVPRVTGPGLAVKMKDGGQVTWHLDLEHNIATSTKPGDHLKDYTVPLKPMLGCIAAAPGPGPAFPTGDSGNWGGNMDFNEVIEGNTVYLPVSVPGALLYFGDGHAAQGDGELTGDALETSMDVELTVDVIHGIRVPSPLVKSPTHIMAMGLAGSLDDAIKAATDTVAGWLAKDYALTPSEIAQVLGTSAEYRISEVADRNAGVVLKLSKERLANIPLKSDSSVPK